MGIFQRGERLETAIAEDMLDDDIDGTRRELRDEVDVDPLVEEATERLREELKSLIARDEWGRELAWRHVARIALGPVLTRLRDQETTIRLLEATRNAPETQPERAADDDLLEALEVALEHAPPVEAGAPIGDALALATETVTVVEQPGPVEATDAETAGAGSAEAGPMPEETQYRWL